MDTHIPYVYHITAAYLEAAASAHAAPREFDQLEGLASVAWRNSRHWNWSF